MCITMCSLVMSPFSRDYIKTEVHYSVIKVSATFKLICEQNSHSAWFLDGRTSILVASDMHITLFPVHY